MFLTADTGTHDICDLTQLKCLQEVENEMRRVQEADGALQDVISTEHIDCDCPSGCNELDFKVQITQAKIGSGEYQIDKFSELLRQALQR